MRKFLFKAFWMTGLFFVVIVGAGYFYGRAKLPELVYFLTGELNKRGVQLDYKAADLPSGGLAVALREVSLRTNDVDYTLTAESAKIGFELGPHWPPLALSLSLKKPVLKEKEWDGKNEPTQGGAKSATTIPKVLSLLLLLCHYEIGVEQGDLAPWGLRRLSASVWSRNLKFGSQGIEGGTVHYNALADLTVAPIHDSPLHLEGQVAFRGAQAELTSGDLEIGPLRISTRGLYDAGKSSWQGRAFIPSSELGVSSPFVSGRTISWLKSLTGRLELELKVEKTGSEGPWLAKGKLGGEKIHLETKDSDISGIAEGGFSFNLEKTAGSALQIDGAANVDLTGSEIKGNGPFQKAAGVAFTGQADGISLKAEFDEETRAEFGAKKISLVFADHRDPELENLTGTLHQDDDGTKIDQIVAAAWKGQLRISGDNKNLEIALENVDANQLFSTISAQAKDSVTGRLSSQFKVALASETEKLKGSGNFKITNGEFKNIKFGRAAAESLKQVPGLGSTVKMPPEDESFREVSGVLSYSAEEITLNNAVISGDRFEVRSPQAIIDKNREIKGTANFYPKESMVPLRNLESLKDDSGHPGIPLLISGPLKSPKTEVDLNAVTHRVTGYVEKRLNTKIPADLQKKVKDGLKKFFK